VSEKVTHHPHRDYIITLLKRQWVVSSKQKNSPSSSPSPIKKDWGGEGKAIKFLRKEYFTSLRKTEWRGNLTSLLRHPEASYFEAVRISSDTTSVILSGAFPREDLIWHHQRHPERCFPAWGSHPL
jgi:hypothetical protein